LSSNAGRQLEGYEDIRSLPFQFALRNRPTGVKGILGPVEHQKGVFSKPDNIAPRLPMLSERSQNQRLALISMVGEQNSLLF
jgi:hypothetical protein